MIIDCIKCHRPYDVAKYRAGQKLRCLCGQVLVVPTDAPNATREVVTLHCANCGGNLRKGDDHCTFCGAMVDFSSARLTAYCTSCLTTSKEGAKFCSSCGKSLTADMDVPEEVEERCPRCDVTMRSRTIGAHTPLECPSCLGIFVGIDMFEELIRKQEARVGEVASAKGQPRKSVLQATCVTYVKCPLCQKTMNRQNYGRISGVIVDFCRDHGYWLDEGELEKIARWVATGGLQKKYRIEKDEARALAQKQKMDRALDRMGGGDVDPRYTHGSPFSSARLGDTGGFGFLDLVTRLFD